MKDREISYDTSQSNVIPIEKIINESLGYNQQIILSEVDIKKIVQIYLYYSHSIYQRDLTIKKNKKFDIYQKIHQENNERITQEEMNALIECVNKI